MITLCLFPMFDQMSKTIKKLEKENIALKKKAEKSDVTVIDLLDEVSHTSTPHLPPALNQNQRTCNGSNRSISTSASVNFLAQMPMSKYMHGH